MCVCAAAGGWRTGEEGGAGRAAVLGACGCGGIGAGAGAWVGCVDGAGSSLVDVWGGSALCGGRLLGEGLYIGGLRQHVEGKKGGGRNAPCRAQARVGPRSRAAPVRRRMGMGPGVAAYEPRRRRRATREDGSGGRCSC